MSRRVNFDGAVGLARAACGIAHRFVFMSSVKVRGEDSGDGAYTEEDPLRPKEGANARWFRSARVSTDEGTR